MSDTNRLGVIIVAAGSGERLGANLPKAFAELNGRELLSYALEQAQLASGVEQVVIVAPAGFESQAAAQGDGFTVVTGGATRHESVGRGLSALAPDIDTVLVHDAARALMPSQVFERVAHEVERTGNVVVPALEVVDALKSIDRASGLITGNVDRSALVAVQTPQGFVRADLERAHASAGSEDFHDDAAVCAAAGMLVSTVEGNVNGFKITYPDDLTRALALVSPPLQADRVGTGTDVHAFGSQRGLWLGGLFWPDELTLEGHSDGDSAAHAIVDALLGAAGLGDIGGMVGVDDPTLAGAHGDVFVREAVSRVLAAGYKPVNVTVQIIANRPKLAPWRLEAESVLSEWVGAPVSVSATTSDGLGITGEGRGIAAVATALLRRA